jgi:hypothetical protein
MGQGIERRPQRKRRKRDQYPVLPYVGAFAFVRDADKPANAKN